MSQGVRQANRMKNRMTTRAQNKAERILTTFGQAQLIITGKGQIELRGGSPDEQTEAKEWISLCMHEAVPRFTN